MTNLIHFNDMLDYSLHEQSLLTVDIVIYE